MQHLGEIKGNQAFDPLERPQTANVLSNIGKFLKNLSQFSYLEEAKN